ncbi:MAG TPA: integrin alpha, partial [Candidatus Syntrophosphaera sp.]|nr:integrin alpha [Candidatus Syntrophosphaera sp.]
MRKLRCAILLILLLMYLSLIYAVNDMTVIAAFQGEHHNSGYGYSMVSLDFNHDGFDDLAVCSPSYDYVYPGTIHRGHGKLYIYFGTNGFNSNTYPSLTYEGTYDSTMVGRQIKGIFRVGDVSGDGFDDLCVYVEDHISWNESY